MLMDAPDAIPKWALSRANRYIDASGMPFAEWEKHVARCVVSDRAGALNEAVDMARRMAANMGSMEARMGAAAVIVAIMALIESEPKTW